jgi:sulfopyruvate decarboxylase alpha subunit
MAAFAEFEFLKCQDGAIVPPRSWEERMAAQDGSWPEDIYAALKRHEVRQVAYVPDAGHSALIRAAHADPDVRAIPLTTEEEGIAVLAGAALGGQRGVLLMQSSGVGNCINMLSLVKNCGFPFLTLVTMRGEWGEFNPWQIPMGSTAEASMRLMDVHVLRASAPEDVAPTMQAACRMAYEGGAAMAVLLSQRLLGAKVF